MRPPAGSGSVDVQIDDEGHRVLLVFSSPDALKLWSADALFGLLKGADLLALADELQIESICFDVSGPAPVEIGPKALGALMDGIVIENGSERLIGSYTTTPNSQLYEILSDKSYALDLPNAFLVIATNRETSRGAIATLFCDRVETAESLARSLPLVVAPRKTVDIVVADRPVLDELVVRFPEVTLQSAR